MVNLLIPTDFTQASFRLVEQSVKTLNKEVNVILFHQYAMPSGINDLLRADPPYAQMMNDSFRQNCKYLKYKYPNLINKICFKYLTGNTQSIFNNFIDANNIDMIVCPENYVFSQVSKSSINPLPFFKKSKLAVLSAFTATVEKEAATGTKPATAVSLVEVALASA